MMRHLRGLRFLTSWSVMAPLHVALFADGYGLHIVTGVTAYTPLPAEVTPLTLHPVTTVTGWRYCQPTVRGCARYTRNA